MTPEEIAKEILYGGTIESKLLDLPLSREWQSPTIELPKLPGRSKRLAISKKQVKFPKLSQLHINEKKAIALHSFANHELLAIEMMAAALLIYPSNSKQLQKFKTGVAATLKDEQKHFSMYVQRMNNLGVEFGDYPLNGFFWQYMEKLKTPSEYLATMALTFEAANLDFASYYRDQFRKAEDSETSEILDIVYQDEITHVSFGHHWLNQWKEHKELWSYYQELLPYPLTPARAKGIRFDRQGRLDSGYSEDLVNKCEKYSDEFKVTNRKEWKS